MVFRIGQLAKEAEVNIETIRYYERRGLINRPEKPNIGYRQYGIGDLQRLQFIRRAKSLGFNLDEILNLLVLSEGHCADVKIIAQQKLNHVKTKIEDLQRLELVLQNLILQCDSNVGKTHCPIIETLLSKK